MKIVSKRELSLALSAGKVDAKLVGERLQRTVALWAARKEIVIVDGYLKLAA